LVRWRNCLPGSVHPGDAAQSPPRLPIATAVLHDPHGDTDSVQNYLGGQGGAPEDTSGAPIGWTTVHLHGAHSPSDADGFPDNMAATGSDQLSAYLNSYDNLDLGLGKVGEFLWYHDHPMNGTRYRGWRLGDDQALTLASFDRVDVLVDLTGLPEGEQLFQVRIFSRGNRMNARVLECVHNG
jgi:hypothetical protein